MYLDPWGLVPFWYLSGITQGLLYSTFENICVHDRHAPLMTELACLATTIAATYSYPHQILAVPEEYLRAESPKHNTLPPTAETLSWTPGLARL